MGLTKKEEKLLKRLFQKRKNDLELTIVHGLKHAEAVEAKGNLAEIMSVTVNKYRREIFELQNLEARLFRELYKHEPKDNSRKTTGFHYKS